MVERVLERVVEWVVEEERVLEGRVVEEERVLEGRYSVVGWRCEV